jgi:hypothetical protein
LRSAEVLPVARQIVLDHPVRTLAAGDPVEFVTREGRQADVAKAMGVPVRRARSGYPRA